MVKKICHLANVLKDIFAIKTCQESPARNCCFSGGMKNGAGLFYARRHCAAQQRGGLGQTFHR
jgi:hypothetical protein